jgi:hypothetical protein
MKKRILSGCLMGLGIGIILVLFLPLTAWLCLIGIALFCVRNKLFIWKMRRGNLMTIVVKKVPKCFRGIVKFIFGVKNT